MPPVSDAHLEALAKRDPSLATDNIARAIEAGTFSSHDFLHPRRTLHIVFQIVMEDRPNRFERDPRRFSSTPRPRRPRARGEHRDGRA